ncbi:unnamed protein product [Orchesella dallaii]|uniref:Uncharacterized protein n=1 Tax=Orchesella dallaii TaxID=48710 RepID=A0ABP1RW21_9HEXA
MNSREGKARKWFQWTAKLLSKPKQEITQCTTDFDTDTPENSNSFPPEFICLPISQPTVECSGIQRIGATKPPALDKLGADTIRTHRLEPPLSPSVLVLETLGKYSRLSLPQAISTSKTFTTNPFPTNSLTIWWNYRHVSFAHILQRSMRWDKFFCQYGHFLTHLNFTYFEETLWQLKQVLIHTPNLQALSIIDLGVKQEATPATILQNKDAGGIIISRHLATLQICEDCQIYLADWLLRLCAHQLVNLIITTENEELLVCVFRRKFEKLKQLRIRSSQFPGAFYEILQVQSNPKLEYLFIVARFCYGENAINYKTYMDFIGQFSTTLVHLCLDMAPVSQGCFGYLKEKGHIFAKIRWLTLRRGLMTVSWEGTQAKKDAEALFPNVTDVKIVYLV